MKKILLLIGALVVLVLLAWVLLARVPSQETLPEPAPTLEGEVDTQTTSETENPIEGEIPDLNPTANTNPFGDAYTNPFE